jgi:hypothetical protein
MTADCKYFCYSDIPTELLWLPASIHSALWAHSGPPNFERFDVRITWNSNKKFQVNRFCNSNEHSEVEQRSSRGRLLYLLTSVAHAVSQSGRSGRFGQVFHDCWGRDYANSVYVLNVLFIYLCYFYIVFNKMAPKKLLEMKRQREKKCNFNDRNEKGT